MAIFHLSAKIISRSGGRSAVAAAAYRAAAKLLDRRTGITFDYRRKKGVTYQKVYLPPTAPSSLEDREVLWNLVENAETRRDSQVAREIEVALPIELTHEQQIHLLEKFIGSEFTAKGIIADVCLHNKPGNPHAHILLTTRSVSKKGFGQKNRAWNTVDQLRAWRKQWEIRCNLRLSIAGKSVRVDSRSFAAQKVDGIPTVHIGQKESAMSQRGIYSPRKELNKLIKEKNMNENKSGAKNGTIAVLSNGPSREEIKQSKIGQYLFLSATDTQNQQRYWHGLFEKNYVDRLTQLFGDYIAAVDGIQTEIGFAYKISLTDGVVLDYGSQIRCDSTNSYEVHVAVMLAKHKGWAGMHLSGSEAFKEAVYMEAALSGAFTPSQLFGYIPTPTNISVIRDCRPEYLTPEKTMPEPDIFNEESAAGESSRTKAIAHTKLKI